MEDEELPQRQAPHHQHHSDNFNMKRDYAEETKDTPVSSFALGKRRKVDFNQEYQTNDFLLQGTPLKSGKIYQHSLFGLNPNINPMMTTPSTANDDSMIAQSSKD
jgi:hypothetical protein